VTALSFGSDGPDDQPLAGIGAGEQAGHQRDAGHQREHEPIERGRDQRGDQQAGDDQRRENARERAGQGPAGHRIGTVTVLSNSSKSDTRTVTRSDHVPGTPSSALGTT
jgi:hypothetical protein